MTMHDFLTRWLWEPINLMAVVALVLLFAIVYWAFMRWIIRRLKLNSHRSLAEAGRDRVRLNRDDAAMVRDALDPNSSFGKRTRKGRHEL